MSEESISLYDLLNLAIGTPQEWVVDFSALHSLLLAVLRQLDIQEVKTGCRDSPPGDRQLTSEVHVTGVTEHQRTEEAQPQIQGDEEPEAQPGTGLQKRMPSSSSPAPTYGTAVDEQRRLLSRIQACEDGLAELVRAQEETVTVVQKCCHRVDTLEETVTSLKDTFQKYPDPEQLSQCVTWDTMQSLLSNTENLQKNAKLVSDVQTAILHLQAECEKLHETTRCLHEDNKELYKTTRELEEKKADKLMVESEILVRAQQEETVTVVQKCCHRVDTLEETVTSLKDTFQKYPDPEQLSQCVTWDTMQPLLSNTENLQKNAELVSDVRTAILHLQAECEKLHETTRCLHEDNKELYKTTRELEEKKADKLMVESEIKADKSVLESKVSRLQFDSATEQLNTMFHELLNKVMGQEQDWHKVIDKLSTEMECKLNRIELDSVKKQLEDRWKSIHQRLQTQRAPEHEDAAGIRKQLVDRFHCLSCDRPVVKHTPGPNKRHLVTLPSTPGFPSHKSIRPFTVYALEQFRQHYRSLRPGTNHYNSEVASRVKVQLQINHRQMEKHHKRSGSQDNMHNDNTTQPSNNMNHKQLGVQHERIAELTDYSHLAMSRSCGGSHTVTSSSQRRTGLQYMKQHSQPEVETVVQSEEVDIIGLDGQIYKGRLNPAATRNADTKLPTISAKDGMCKTKDKPRGSPSHKPAVSPEVGYSPLVHHTQSPRSVQCSRSVSSISGRDWPVSALGCASQSSITQTSAVAESNSERPDNQQVSM